MKKAIGWLVLICLFAGSICGLVFGIMFARTDKKLKESNNPAIIEEYKQQINNLELKFEEVNNQLKIVIETNSKHEETIKNLNLSIEQKDIDISNLKSEKTDLENLVNEKQLKIDELDNKIKVLETDKESNLSEIESLKNEKNQLQSEKENLQQTLTEKESKITVLETEKISMQNEITDLQNAKMENQELIKTLNTQIVTLQNEVTRLMGLLESYEDIKNGSFEVKFMVKETERFTFGVKYNSSLTEIPVVEDTEEYRFDGWSLDGINIVDVATVIITENTTFYAVVTDKFVVNFNDDTTVLNTEIVLSGASVNEFEAPKKVGFKFLGWSLDKTNIVDLSALTITENTTFYALYEELPKIGLFNSNNEMLISWDDLINESYIKVSNNVLTGSSKKSQMNGTLIIPNDITSVDLMNCSNLINVIMPDSVSTINFSGCSNLVEIEIPKEVVQISSTCFSDCKNLEKITVDENNSVYDSRENCNAIIETSTNTLLYGFKTSQIPNTIVSVASKAFKGILITSIYIPNSVETIGINCFEGCSELVEVTFENNSKITRLENSLFYNCKKLKSINVPNSVVSIGYKVFYYCSALESIKLSENLVEIGTEKSGSTLKMGSGGTFQYCTSLKSIYIPNSVEKIICGNTSPSSDIFYKCSTSMKIYVGASEKPTGWEYYLYYVDGSHNSNGLITDVYYGYTYEQYLAEIGL